jgi:hypothetical protein
MLSRPYLHRPLSRWNLGMPRARSKWYDSSLMVGLAILGVFETTCRTSWAGLHGPCATGQLSIVMSSLRRTKTATKYEGSRVDQPRGSHNFLYESAAAARTAVPELMTVSTLCPQRAT